MKIVQETTERYKCDHCGLDFDSVRIANIHEDRCPKNPKVNTCLTCENLFIAYDTATYQICVMCEAQVALRSADEEKEFVHADCLHWELRKDDHPILTRSVGLTRRKREKG